MSIDFGTTHATSAIMVGVTREKKPRLVFMDEYRYDPRDSDNRRPAPSTTAAHYNDVAGVAPRAGADRDETEVSDP